MKNIAKALLAVQMKMKPAKKGAVNPFFKSKYADLKTIWETCIGLLNSEGVLVVQQPLLVDGVSGLNTMLVHAESGEHIDSFLPIVASDKADPQKFGSALTYTRRYSLACMVGVITEDDDGNAASKPNLTPHPEDDSDIYKFLKLDIENAKTEAVINSIITRPATKNYLNKWKTNDIDKYNAIEDAVKTKRSKLNG